jgi:hypothetical protein
VIFHALCAALLAAAPASHFEGALLSDVPRFTARLAEGQLTGTETPVEQLTREQLQAEYTRLAQEKPGLGAPIALTSVGGGLLILSAPLLWVALIGIIGGGNSSIVLGGYILLIFGSAIAVTGGVLLAVGLVKLFQRIGERRAYTQRMEDINARLESLDRTGAPPPPAELPPPTPPGAGFIDVRPDLVVATF